MATKSEGKAKKGKDGEKRSAKKLDDALQSLDQSDQPSQDEPESTEPEPVVEAPKQPSPEPVYDEPTLSELIIESYEGDKTRGLFDGEGMAYFAGAHVYKGQFSEGFMHGKGQYTWADGVVYEGEFCRNQITGKGMYYWLDGSTYEGEVQNGKRHGNGTFRCKNYCMTYVGEWSMGNRHGKGRLEYDIEGRSFYEGDWVNNVKHGFGTRQYPSGNMYQGMWFNNVRHGEGTMKWHDRDQVYSGQWENGIQHGMGQHIWLLRRVQGSQYPLRNMYEGEFVNGLRHGYGTFYYANGAKYEGGWKNNMKHGKGKFTFKNGRIYEGMFEKDHIVEYPDFTMDGTTTPDLSNIRTRTPLPVDNMSVHSNDSRNTISPNFQLDIDQLLNEFTESDREDEASQVMFVITRHVTTLRRIYHYYSCLGYDESPDNTYIMNRMQFWRFLKDCSLHHHEITLMEMDRLLGPNKASYELHNPYDRILQRQFINHLIVLAYRLYHEEHQGTSSVLAWCMSKLIADHIARYACNVKGHFYYETRRAVNALVHLDQSYEIYQSLCTARKYRPKEPSLKMRKFLYMMKDLKLINSDLTAKCLIEILASDDPLVADGEGCYNLELEMTFLEFFEALIGSAEVFVTEAVVKDPTTPRPSTTLTKDESMYSIPGSPSRITSQVGLDEQSVAQGSPREATSPETGSPTRAVSSAEGTTKTGDGASSKAQDALPSVSNLTAVNSEAGHGDVQPLAEQQKSASFISTHTNNTEEQMQLMQSSVSIGGHTLGGQTEGEEEGEARTQAGEGVEDEDEEELDETTRQFNFWTHQIHIFFVRKFFPAAEKMLALKQAVERRMLEEARCRVSQEPLVEEPEPVKPQLTVEEKSQA